jgi:hypothetical protein
MLKRLIKKTRNARFGVEVEVRAMESTKSGGSTYQGLTHRGAMKAIKEGNKAIKELKPK